MKKERDFRVVIIIALIISVISIALGYAAFSTSLEISSDTYLEGKSWLIKFDNLSEPTIVGNAKQVSTPNVSATSINLGISLATTGDQVSYTFDVSNKGTLDAKLSSSPIVSGIPESMMSKVSYIITHADGTAIQDNEMLKAGETQSMKITAKFLNDDIESSTNFSISIIFLYIQA